MRRIALVIFVALALMAASGCGDIPSPPSTPAPEPDTTTVPAGPPPVRLTLQVTRSGDTVRLTGRTNLPNGAVIVYEVQQVSGAWISDDGHATVKAGRFNGTVKATPSGKLEAWAAFMLVPGVVKQPASVRELYGDNGDLIPNGTEAGGMRRVEVTATVK